MATATHIRELAQAIANQAQAIADDNMTTDAYAVAQLIAGNVSILVEWAERERKSAKAADELDTLAAAIRDSIDQEGPR